MRYEFLINQWCSKITGFNLIFAQDARKAFNQGKIDTCSKILSEQLAFLIDEIIGSSLESEPKAARNRKSAKTY